MLLQRPTCMCEPPPPKPKTQAECDAAVAAAVGRWGRLDIMVANAGIVKAAPFLEMAEQVGQARPGTGVGSAS